MNAIQELVNEITRLRRDYTNLRNRINKLERRYADYPSPDLERTIIEYQKLIDHNKTLIVLAQDQLKNPRKY